MLLRDHLEAAGVACELVARDPDRANLVARLPGTGGAPSLAFVGHLDVVPADPRDWTHPPFDAVVDGRLPLRPRRRGHKNELAARVVAMAETGPVRGSGRVVTCGCSPSPTRRTARPTSACAGCSSTAPTSARTSR